MNMVMKFYKITSVSEQCLEWLFVKWFCAIQWINHTWFSFLRKKNLGCTLQYCCCTVWMVICILTTFIMTFTRSKPSFVSQDPSNNPKNKFKLTNSRSQKFHKRIKAYLTRWSLKSIRNKIKNKCHLIHHSTKCYRKKKNTLILMIRLITKCLRAFCSMQ